MSVWPKYSLSLSVGPSVLMSLEDAKEHLRVEHSDDDDYITSLVSVASSHLDGDGGVLGRCILTQTWVLKTSRLSGKERLPIPLGPYVSTASLKYYDVSDVQQTANLSDYVVFADSVRGYVEPKTAWPAMYNRPDAIELTFVAGEATAPTPIVQAAKLIVGDLYENREQTLIGISAQTLETAMNLINTYRVGWVKA